ncbi:MAG: sigma 54-interacting transcriptional regulator [Deltaproteobacteria bacterium]|nr:sigma 54-interacting transcriptional regulator [Deltaproteobacteria bacterium]
MRACLATARERAGDAAELCLVGEPGSGRAELARALHAHGPRAAEPFVRLPAALVRRGSLPAGADPIGRGDELHGVIRIASKWEAARGGTLFVADIEDLDDAAQAVLAGLVTGELRDGRPVPRLLASASAEPATLRDEGSLHPRLAERLASRVLHVPALRERGDDLGALCVQLLGEWAARNGGRPAALTAAALADLARRPFDGNIPELRELLEQAAALATSGVIESVPDR